MGEYICILIKSNAYVVFKLLMKTIYVGNNLNRLYLTWSFFSCYNVCFSFVVTNTYLTILGFIGKMYFYTIIFNYVKHLNVTLFWDVLKDIH